MEDAVVGKWVLELGETGFYGPFWGPCVQGWVGVVWAVECVGLAIAAALNTLQEESL